MLLVKKELKLWIPVNYFFRKESKDSCRTFSFVLKDDYLVLYSLLLRAWKSSVNILPTLSVFSFWKRLKILNLPLTVFSYWKSRKSPLPLSVFSIPEEPENLQERFFYLVCILYTRRAWKSPGNILLPCLRKDPLTLSVFSSPQEPENLKERSSYLVCILYTGKAENLQERSSFLVCILYIGRSWKSSGKILLPCLYSLYRKSLKISRKDPFSLS